MKGQATDIWEWFSLEWFQPSILRGFVWENQDFLYAVPFVPLLLLLRWLIYIKFRQKFYAGPKCFIKFFIHNY